MKIILQGASVPKEDVLILYSPIVLPVTRSTLKFCVLQHKTLRRGLNNEILTFLLLSNCFTTP